MEDIKDRFEKKATAAGIEIKELLKQHGDKNRRNNFSTGVPRYARYAWFSY